MIQLIVSILPALLMLALLSARLRRYRPPEQPLLLAAFSAHIATATLQPTLMHLLGGGDMFGYYHIGILLLERLYRSPAETIGLLWGLLIQNGDPLPFPTAIVTNSSTGSMVALTTIALGLYDVMGRSAYSLFMSLSIITICYFIVLGALYLLRARAIA